mmetsp:Transcript_15022/g.38601  ORF Transcript_15022/g.38601 Transcript_15022/m.38601 type:complete len:237 (-) Transcript_15022:556-1266(-)
MRVRNHAVASGLLHEPGPRHGCWRRSSSNRMHVGGARHAAGPGHPVEWQGRCAQTGRRHLRAAFVRLRRRAPRRPRRLHERVPPNVAGVVPTRVLRHRLPMDPGVWPRLVVVRAVIHDAGVVLHTIRQRGEVLQDRTLPSRAQVCHLSRLPQWNILPLGDLGLWRRAPRLPQGCPRSAQGVGHGSRGHRPDRSNSGLVLRLLHRLLPRPYRDARPQRLHGRRDHIGQLLPGGQAGS